MALLEKHLIVKRSTIPRAGKGLFTNIFIAKGTIIVEYKGRISSWKDTNHDEGRNAYIYYVSKHHVIDAKDHPKALARYANDIKGPFGIEGIKNNSQYVKIGSKIFIKSMKDIPPGNEILIGYGKSYWAVRSKNKVP